MSINKFNKLWYARIMERYSAIKKNDQDLYCTDVNRSTKCSVKWKGEKLQKK